MAIGKKKANEGTIEVAQLAMESAILCVLGRTPMIYNSMSFKAKTDLLIGGKTKTRAERAATIKHDPIAEYRDSVYRFVGDRHPTRLFFPAGGFKKVMATAALEVPGAAKSQINRLLWITPRDVEIFGVPELFISVVRNSDPGHTPDMRTRAILPRWAARFTINYAKTRLSMNTIANLLGAGGQIVGIGDWRQEKGSGDFGQFDVVSPDNPDFLEVLNTGGREAQDEALDQPVPYRGDLGENDETERLLEILMEESARREKIVTQPISANGRGRRKATDGPAVTA